MGRYENYVCPVCRQVDQIQKKEGIGQRTGMNRSCSRVSIVGSIANIYDRKYVKAEPIEQASKYYRYFEALHTLSTIVPLTSSVIFALVPFPLFRCSPLLPQKRPNIPIHHTRKLRTRPDIGRCSTLGHTRRVSQGIAGINGGRACQA